jgi:hypothetical protein
VGIRTGNPRGRPKGSPNKATVARQIEVAESGETPLAFLLRTMRDEQADEAKRLDAAKAAAPYVHPRLAAVELSGDMTMHHEDALRELE